MSNYTQSTNFATKDALPSGDPLKIVKGTEINTEFVNISVAIATKADLNSPALVTPALGTPASGNLANCTFPTLNQNTTGTAANVTGTVAVANGGTGVTSSTGTGSVVLSNSPTLVTPALGTPSALVGTNITGTAAGLSIGGNAATATNASTVTTVTTTQVLNATAGASVDAVGTYAFAVRPGNGGDTSGNALNPGATVAGSSLRFTNSLRSESSALSGTWRCMGFMSAVVITPYGEPTSTSYGPTLFLRIS